MKLCPTFAGAVLLQPIPVNYAALCTGATIGLGPYKKRGPGQPKKYATENERKAAEAAAKREKRRKQNAQRKRMQLRRMLEAGRRNPAPLTYVEQARAELRAVEQLPEEEELARAEEMAEYDRQIARQEERDAKRVTVEDLEHGAGLADGMYLTDAPQGLGLLEVKENVAEISDARQVRQDDFGPGGGREVTPNGFGAHEDGNAPMETDEQWMENHCRWDSLLNCYRPKCRFPVVGILPEDVDKPALEARYHCWLHTPLRE